MMAKNTEKNTEILDYAIVGGGISGLASAWFLRQRGHSIQVLEAAAECGGTLRSRVVDGFLVEQGPNSTLENTDALRELIEGIHLTEALQAASPAGKQRYILKNQHLEPLPLGPGPFLRTPLFSVLGKLRMLVEPFIGRAAVEESVAAFVRRRLGQEFLDWAIDPFISGVYAGDPERLSVQAATAKVYALEAEHRSLIVGMVRKFLKGQQSGPAPSGRLIAFAGGMQTLANGVVTALGPGGVRTQAQVTSLKRSVDGIWRLGLASGEEVTAHAVVLCLPADKAAELLAPLAPSAATALRAIAYPVVASVALGFRREQVHHHLDGFGFLIPRRCAVETLGTLFSSSLFPERAPKGHVLLTSFLGGARHPEIREWDERMLVRQVLRDIGPVLGIKGIPVLRAVTVWPRAIPQYEIGHLGRVAVIDQVLAGFPGLYTRANWREGISVADCVRNARTLAMTCGPHAQVTTVEQTPQTTKR
ncbi:Coproporphyrinogen III oxidase [Gammaproteobacteria bacterium]